MNCVWNKEQIQYLYKELRNIQENVDHEDVVVKPKKNEPAKKAKTKMKRHIVNNVGGKPLR